MAVVTISSEMGSGAPEIAMGLAQRLKYRFVDREVITEAARRYGLVEAKLADLDERKPSLSALGRGNAALHPGDLGSALRVCGGG